MVKYGLFLSGILLLPLASWAQDEDASVNFVGGISIGYTGLDFDAKLDSTPTFPSLVFTGTASYESYYINLSYADSLGDDTISEEEDVGDARRTDLDLTFGYRWNDSWNIYLGYKDGETDIDFRLRDTTITRNEFYRKDGWFVGTTYRVDLTNAGSLNFNIGYVELDTDNLFLGDIEEDDDDDDSADEAEEFDDLTGRHNGDADGWSYGVSWLVPVNNSLFFNTTFKINKYDETITFDGTKYSADQKLSFFNVGILYLF